MKVFLSVALVLFCACEITESAMLKANAGGDFDLTEYTENGYNYSVYKNEAYITGCDENVIEGDIVFPSKLGEYPVVSINECAFLNNTKITGIKIPDSIRQICYDAFSGCSNLNKIILHNNIQRIDQYAFLGTAYMNDINNWENGSLYIGKYLIKVEKTVKNGFPILPDTVGIANEAFDGCMNLTEMIIPYGVKYIGNYAFYNCGSLCYIHIPSTVLSIGPILINDGLLDYICSDSEDCFVKTYAEENNITFFKCGTHSDISGEPTTEEMTTQPVVTQPATTQPTTTKPVVTEPATTKPTEVPTTEPSTKPVVEPTTKPVETTKPVPTTKPEPIEEKIIKKPSTTEVKYGETLILHADFENIPDGATIEWSVEGDGVTIVPSEDGKTCAVTSTSTGDVTITAKYTDANGVEHVSEQEIESNASFWQKIVSFFKNLFGISRIIEQVVKF